MSPFYLLVRIAFFQNVRRTLPLLHQYRPHLVANNDGEYLGVEFFAGTPAQFDRPCLAHCKPLYDIDYSPLLAAGTPFAIMEGAAVSARAGWKWWFGARLETGFA